MQKRKERSEEPGEREPENAGELRGIVADAKAVAAKEETQVRLRTASTGNRTRQLSAPVVKSRPKSIAAPDTRRGSDDRTERKMSSGASFDEEFIPPPPLLEDEPRSDVVRVSDVY